MNELADRLSSRVTAVVIFLITLAGMALRFHLFGDSVFGDELSTLWIVQNNNFTEVISVVHSDAEITPPLYFMLAWLTTHLGSSPELVRLPALIAGTLTIPMTYLFGLRTLGRATGIVGALVVALSPYMTFLSAYGRGYALMIFFVLGSTLALLAALRSGRWFYWTVYGLCCCLAMYSHYTALFVLVAQFAWVLWVHPPARRPALLAVAGAAALYLPWITGVLGDLNSPTQAVLEFLQGQGFRNKVESITQLIAGEPMVDLSEIPGELGLLLIGVGLAGGVISAIPGVRSWYSDPRMEERRKMFLLIVATAAATLAAELILLLLGTDLLSDRNLSATWVGLPVLVGALFTIPSCRVGLALALITLSGLTVGTAKTFDRKVSGTGYEKLADFIEEVARPGDVILDISHYTPVPLTQLDAYLPAGHPEFRVNLPEGAPPFLPLKSVVRPPKEVIRKAFKAAEGNRIFVVSKESPSNGSGLLETSTGEVSAPSGWQPSEVKTWPGFVPVTVTVFERSRP